MIDLLGFSTIWQYKDILASALWTSVLPIPNGDIVILYVIFKLYRVGLFYPHKHFVLFHLLKR